MTENQYQAKGVLYAIFTACLWGFLAIGLQVASTKVSALNIVWIRFGIAFFVLMMILKVRGELQWSAYRPLPWALLIMSLALAINYYGFMKGVELVGASRTQVVIQLGPILLALYGVLVLKERPAAIQCLGFVLAGLGMVLFYWQELQVFVGNEGQLNLGLALVLMAALAWTLFAILQKGLVKRFPPQVLNLFVYGFAFLAFTPMVEWSGFEDLPTWCWVLLLLFGVNTLFAYGALGCALKYAPAYKVSVIITMNPMITVIVLSILHLMQVDWIDTEAIPLGSWIGTLLVIFGAILAIAGERMLSYFRLKA